MLPISFLKPYYLLLLLILIPISIYFYKKGTRPKNRLKKRFAFYARLVLVVLVVAILARPVFNLLSRDLSVLFLVDRSDSLLEGDRELAREIVSQSINLKRENDDIGLVTFASEPSVEIMPSHQLNFKEFNSFIKTDFTDIEAALKLGLSLLPERGNKKVVLLSDGNENMGKAERVISDYKKRDIAIDIVPLGETDNNEVFVKNIFLPQWVNTGESFELNINVYTTNSTEGQMRVYLDDVLQFSHQLELQAGENLFAVTQNLNEGGFHKYRVEIDASPDTRLENNYQEAFVIVKGDKRVLLIGENGPEVSQLATVLKPADIIIKQQTPSAFSFNLEDMQLYDALILKDVHANYLTRKQMNNIYTYVRELGGGLIVTGGKDSFGAGAYNDTLLDTMLPVNSDLKTKTVIPTTTLLVVLDKSGSMEYKNVNTAGLSKLDLAKEATVAIVDILEQEEKMGIIAFDARSEVVMPIQQVEDKKAVVENFSFLKPGGGTNIYYALERARKVLAEDESAVKHIILLSDGHSVGGDFEEVMTEISELGITVSTVAIGKGVDTALMSQLAKWGGGRYYYTNDLTSLPQIFVDEARRIVRNPVMEKEFKAEVVNEPEFIENLYWTELPSLEGYIATTPRPLADVYLISDEKYPILAGWRFGLGRVVSFTADLGESFSTNWLDWSGYSHFWSGILNRVIRNSYSDNIFPSLYREGDKGVVQVDAIRDNGDYYNFLVMEARISNPDTGTRTVKLEQTGPGLYRGDFKIEEDETYLVSIQWQDGDEEKNLSTGLVVSFSPEYSELGRNDRLIQQLTNETGGQVLSSPQQIFADRPLTYTSRREIWQPLLLTLIILFIIDVGIRVVDMAVISRIWGSFISMVSILIRPIRESGKHLEED